MLPHEEYLQIPLSPGNCLAWSQDGLLAIAAQCEVHILVPKRGSSQEVAPAPWTRVSFDATRFTFAELPLAEQAPSTKMSIAEEQGEYCINSIAWSPPGLAVHQRSALAVLTSNNVLSLWASSSDPTKSESWSRVLVINENYRPNSSAKMQSEGRIRAFAWADRLHGPKLGAPLSTPKPGLHILALANDDGNIDLLSVQGPRWRDNLDLEWRARTVTVSSVSDIDGWSDFRQDSEHGSQFERRGPPSRYSLFAASMGAGKRIDGVLLSPWIYQDGKFQSVLSIRAQLSICHMCISVKEEQVSCDSVTPDSFQLEYLNDLSLSTSNETYFPDHDVAWHYFTMENENCLVVACGRHFDLYRLKIHSSTFTFERVYGADLPEIEYDIDGSLKLIAVCPISVRSGVGAVQTQLYLANPRSEIATAGLRAPFSNREDPFETLAIATVSPLQRQLSKCISRFSAQEKLGSSVCAKAKGIATYGSIVALSVTLAPGPEVEFSNAAEDNTVVLFNTNLGTDDTVPWPWELSLPVDPEPTITLIIDALLDLKILANAALNPISLRLLYGLIPLSLIIDDGLRSTRCRIAKRIIPILISFCGCNLENESKLLSALENGERVTVTENISDVQQMIAVTSKALSTSSQTREYSLLDMCPCCPSDVHLLWAADMHAQCERGHTFSRCCLTFLPILDPQWSKICADCKREFINEHIHPEMSTRCGPNRILNSVNPSVEDGNKPTTSFENETWCHLASYLFEKFDKCPYCNGFYFG